MEAELSTQALRIGPSVLVKGADVGPLAGLSFVAKDLIDVAGYQTGVGVPEWLDAQPIATSHAPVVQQLLDAGATLVGKAHADEFAFSLSGENPHYGTPLNAAAPKHVPGGSSSGSASAVAQELCDFALGTDTAGSIRVPASYCGLVGVRPPHGVVSSQGVVPLAQRFDTVGWLTRTTQVADLVSEVLIKDKNHRTSVRPQRLLWAEDYFSLLPAKTDIASLRAAAEELAAELDAPLIDVVLGDGLPTPDELITVFRAAQGFQAWQNHGEWIQQHPGAVSLAITERFLMASQELAQSQDRADEVSTQLRERFAELLGADGQIVLPSAAGGAPLAGHLYAERFRRMTLQFSILAPLSGLAQISLPLAHSENLPLGLGLLG